MLWDIFCKVIDNHGDIGVCWRLSAQLAGRGQQVRLWVDDPGALAWMAPEGAANVEVRAWHAGAAAPVPGDVVVEAFGCELDPGFQAAIAAKAASGPAPLWINLEYLTAEPFAQRAHGLPSPVSSGPAAGLTKHFFYPGFAPGTGGLLREPGLEERHDSFARESWLRARGIRARDARVVSLFCYEPAVLPDLLAQLAAGPDLTHLLVTHGRAGAATRAAAEANDRSRPGWNSASALRTTFLPLLTQDGYDELLWACDFNFVRGEDSLVRALWAGKPFAWHIYPQDDDAHHAKLDAFLDWLDAPPSLRRLHAAWNSMSAGALPPLQPQDWTACVARGRQRLLAQDDLVTQLLRFESSRRSPR